MLNFNFSFVKVIQKLLKKITKQYKKTSKNYYNFFQRIQLTFIYFFGMVVLIYTIRNSLGILPETLYQLFPFFEQILEWKFLKILATPEKTFILYLLVLEVLINRPFFNFSILVKFNVLLLFILEMFQNLIISYWDLIFSREIDILGSANFMDKNLTIIFYSVLFLFFFGLYFYCYILSLRGLFPIFPGPLQRVVDSVAFWLQVKPSNDPKKN
jgi:hypothetical protein